MAVDDSQSLFSGLRFNGITEQVSLVNNRGPEELEIYDEDEECSELFAQLVACFFQRDHEAVRRKRSISNASQAAATAANSGANHANPVSIDEGYTIFRTSAQNNQRASFTKTQTETIRRLIAQGKADPNVSTYEKIQQQCEKLKGLPEEGFRTILRKIVPEYEEIEKRLQKKNPIKSLQAYMEYLPKQGQFSNLWNNKPGVNKAILVANDILFRLETASKWFSDIIFRSSTQSIIVLTDWAPLASGNQPEFRNLIVLLNRVLNVVQKINQEELKPISQRNLPELSVWKDQLKRTDEQIKNASHTAATLFEKYLEIRKQVTTLHETKFPTRDHFANISQLINREDVPKLEKFPNLKRDMVVSLGRFFELRRLEKPKELDNFQGLKLETINQLVSDAIEKVRIKLGLEKHTAVGGELSELRIYNDADRDQYIIIDNDAMKHVAERHYAQTFDPKKGKELNTKFKREMPLENIVEISYQEISKKKSEIFASRKEYYNAQFTLDGQEYTFGIKIEANKKIQEGDIQIAEGDRLIADGEAKILEATRRGAETPDGKALSGGGAFSKKLGEDKRREGETKVAEGMRDRKVRGAYQFAQVYPEPRNAVVFFMSPHDISNPENNPKSKEFLLAYQRRCKKYRTPVTYCAITQNSDSTFTYWQLTSANEQGWTWARVEGEGPLKGTYTKVTIVGNGNHDRSGGLVIKDASGTRTIGPREASRAFALLFSGSSKKAQQIRLLACHQKPEDFGEALRSALKDNGIQSEQIIGSESAVYIANRDTNLQTGTKAGSKYYGVSSPGQQGSQIASRGVEEVKWVIDVQEDGEVMGIPRRVASHGSKTSSLDIAVHSDAISGPFGIKAEEVAEKIQQANRDLAEAKKQLDEAWTSIEAATEEAREKAAQISGIEKLKWLIDIKQVRKEGERVFVRAWNKETLATREVELSQAVGRQLITARERLEAASAPLKPYFVKRADGHLSQIDSVGAPTTLNGGFLALVLVDILKNQSPLPLEAKICIYLDLVGATIATVEDVVKLAKLIAPNGIIARSLSVVGRIFEAGNILFMTADLGWKIYQLANTKDPVNRVELGIEIGFTSAALGLAVGSTAVAWASPAAAGAAAGFGVLAVPLVGLSFGFGALGRQWASNKEGVRALRKYLIDGEKAYQSGGFTQSDGVLIPNPAAIITKLDFINGVLTFGGDRLPKSWYNGWSTPRMSSDRFNLREALQLPEKAELDTQTMDLLLPSTPNLNVNYGQVYTPIGSVSLDTEETAIEEKLKNAGPFCGSNSDGTYRAGFVPGQTNQIVSAPLTMDVVLDAAPRRLWFHQRIDRNMSYNITGGGGQITLAGFHSGVRATLRNEENPGSFFHLKTNVPLLHSSQLSLQDGILTIRETADRVIRIDVKNLRGIHRISSPAGSCIIDLNKNNIEEQIKFDLFDFRVPAASNLRPSDFLKDPALKKQLTDVVTVVMGPPLPQRPGANATDQERKDYVEQVNRSNERAAYVAYDSKRQRFIPDLLIPAYKTHLSPSHEGIIPYGIRYVGNTGDDQFFFFDKQNKKFFYLDPETIRCSHYELGFTNAKTTIEAVGGYRNRPYIQQKTPLDLSKPEDEATLTHVVEDDKIWLVGLSGLSNVQFKKLLNSLDALRKRRVSPQLGDHFPNDAKYNFRNITNLRSLPRAAENDTHPRKEADMSEWITMQGLDENGIVRQVLANFATSHVIWIDYYQIPDLQPIKSWTTGQGQESFLFYSRSNKKVYFAQAEGDQLQLSLSEIDTDGKPVIWYGQNENGDKMDLILEGAEDILTVDSQGTILFTRKTVYGGEFPDYVLASESSEITAVVATS